MVDVIALYSASGEIRPLRLQMEDDEHQLLRVNIEKILSVKQVDRVGVEAAIYLCRANVWNRAWVFELKYTFRTHIWSMTKR